jgi:two-component system LytT family response regulator
LSALRVVVVDDEPLARRRLVRLLKGEGADVVATCANGREAVEVIPQLAPDLVFLDVQMPDADGFEVIGQIGAERMPAVIFVTAYDQYAIRAFEVHALDYLLKPFDRVRLADALRRARPRPAAPADDGALDERLRALVEQMRTPAPVAAPEHLEWLMVRTRDKVQVVRAPEIAWIEADGNYVRLHTAGGAYLIREKIGTLEERLDPAVFVRIHRSYVVNLSHVRELRPWFSGDYAVVLHDGSELRLSRSYRERLGKRIAQYT